MSIINLCQRDPLLNLLYDLFHANIVRVPDARLQPLAVIAQRGSRSFFRGDLAPLLTDQAPLNVEPSATLLSDLSGRRSRRVTLDLGLHLLRGFLRGFGLPGADLTSALGDGATLAFALPAIRRVAVDVNALGRELMGRMIDFDNPAAACFRATGAARATGAFHTMEPYRLLLIDAVLMSAQLAIVIGGGKGQALAFDMSALKKLAAEVGATLKTRHNAEAELTLSSPHALTFAFSCVQLRLDDLGAIVAMPPDHSRRTLGADPGPAELPERVMLSAGPGLVLWDGL